MANRDLSDNFLSPAGPDWEERSATATLRAANSAARRRALLAAARADGDLPGAGLGAPGREAARGDFHDRPDRENFPDTAPRDTAPRHTGTTPAATWQGATEAPAVPVAPHTGGNRPLPPDDRNAQLAALFGQMAQLLVGTPATQASPPTAVGGGAAVQPMQVDNLRAGPVRGPREAATVASPTHRLDATPVRTQGVLRQTQPRAAVAVEGESPPLSSDGGLSHSTSRQGYDIRRGGEGRGEDRRQSTSWQAALSARRQPARELRQPPTEHRQPQRRDSDDVWDGMWDPITWNARVEAEKDAMSSATRSELAKLIETQRLPKFDAETGDKMDVVFWWADVHKRFTRYPLNKAVMSQLWPKISAALIGEAAKDKEQLSMSPLHDIRDKLMLWFGPPDVFQGMVRAMMQRRSPGVALHSWLRRHRTIFEFLQTSPVALSEAFAALVAESQANSPMLSQAVRNLNVPMHSLSYDTLRAAQEKVARDGLDIDAACHGKLPVPTQPLPSLPVVSLITAAGKRVCQICPSKL